jgi:hypothetical protein
MNLSETAFLAPHPDGYELRWFTPAVEMTFAPRHAGQRARVVGEGIRSGEQARF